jgi:transposase InsO family protein
MKAEDVSATLEMGLQASGCHGARVVHKPRLLSDNGSSYISGDLAEWLQAQNMTHVRGAPNHSQTQGKIERWHQTLKNRILLENWKTTSCPVISRRRSPPSSSTTTTTAITRASTTSLPPMSTSDAASQSCSSEKGSSARPSNSGACSTAKPLTRWSATFTPTTRGGAASPLALPASGRHHTHRSFQTPAIARIFEILQLVTKRRGAHPASAYSQGRTCEVTVFPLWYDAIARNRYVRRSTPCY